MYVFACFLFNSDLRGFFQSSDTSVSSSPISLVRSSLKPEPEPALPEPPKVGLLLYTAILVLHDVFGSASVILKVTNALKSTYTLLLSRQLHNEPKKLRSIFL